MKKVVLLLAGILCLPFLSFCGSGNNLYTIHNPQWWSSGSPDDIGNVYMEVTPRGLYADIELTFTMYANNLGSGDSLQGILSFELPPNSYIHGSWLWLDETTIIEAELMERKQALQIYSSYIPARKDPSYLVKNGNNLYQINVFPMSANYARKVKLKISTLMTQRGDKALLTLPMNLMLASEVKPDLMLLVNTNSTYDSPIFDEVNFSTYLVNNVGGTYLLNLPQSTYTTGRDLTLVFNTPDAPSITVFPVGQNESIYELKLPAAETTAAPRCFNFIIDNPTGIWQSGAIYSLEEIKRYLRSFMRHDLRSTDSFNVFFTNANGTLTSAYPSWTAALPGNINNLMTNILTDANTLNTEDLYTAGILFGQTKPASEAQTIIITNDHAHSLYSDANALVNDILDSVGSFTNKIHVINFAHNNTNPNPGSEALFTNLCSASGGTYFKHNGAITDLFIGAMTFDLDIRGALHTIALNGVATNVYDVTLPVSNGITYNRYELTGAGKFYPSMPYLETGKFYGTIAPGNVDVDYLYQGNYAQYQPVLNTIEAGTAHHHRGWVNNYLMDLEGINNQQVQAEILQVSISNDVLCYETAFLALENGDTIQKDSLIKYITLESTLETMNRPGIKCYPNPFSGVLTIESTDDIERVEIIDVAGRLVFGRSELHTRRFEWDGRDNNGVAAATGIYFVKLRHNGRTETIKVSKL